MTPSLKDYRLDWNRLKTFYYVVHLGTFSAAARYLHLEQTAISRSIQNLENQLQIRLFYRNKTTNSLQLTKKGEVLFKSVEKCYLEMQTVSMVLDKDNTLQGDIKIALAPEIAAVWLSPYIEEFITKYPDLHLIIQEIDLPPTFDIYEVDSLIYPFIKDRADLVQSLLGTLEYGLYGSRSYIERFGFPQTSEDLIQHRLIGCGDPSGIFPDITWFLPPKLKEKKRPFMQVNSVFTRSQMAAHGLGLIAAPKNHPAIIQYNLISLLPDLPKPSLQIFYIYPKQFESLKRVKALGDYFKTKLGNSQQH